MSAQHAATPHQASPEAAMEAIRAFDGPLLLDLDETLYLRNSTEDFIDSATPGFAAAMLMQLLDWIRPWRWTGGHTTRDVWRVRMVTLLFPWTQGRWRQRLPGLVDRFTNEPLIGVLREHASAPIIVTLGFRPIVTPLIKALKLDESCIIASRYSAFEDRQRGKLDLVLDSLGADTVSRGLVLTDSTDDLPLLDACARPLLTLWPSARYHSALSDVYIPGRYLSRIKHPGERYILRGILQEDFAFWLICSFAMSASTFGHIAGLLLLLLSFWAIYEVGYVDNDRIAERFEEQPKLSRSFHQKPFETTCWEPWIWALTAGAGAIFLLRWPVLPAPPDFGKWLAVLLLTHLSFRLYNRMGKPTRVWLYPALQFARSAAFTVLVPISLIGTVALTAHVLARWLPYYVYRLGGREWPDTPMLLIRLMFFVVMALLLAVSQGAAPLFSWTAAALLSWNLLRARNELYRTFKDASFIDQARKQA